MFLGIEPSPLKIGLGFLQKELLGCMESNVDVICKFAIPAWMILLVLWLPAIRSTSSITHIKALALINGDIIVVVLEPFPHACHWFAILVLFHCCHDENWRIDLSQNAFNLALESLDFVVVIKAVLVGEDDNLEPGAHALDQVVPRYTLFSYPSPCNASMRLGTTESHHFQSCSSLAKTRPDLVAISVPSRSNAAILLLAVSLTEGFAIKTESSAFIHFSEDFLGLMSKKGCSVVAEGSWLSAHVGTQCDDARVPFFCTLLSLLVVPDPDRFIKINDLCKETERERVY